jgi:hypothetical protein
MGLVVVVSGRGCCGPTFLEPEMKKRDFYQEFLESILGWTPAPSFKEREPSLNPEHNRPKQQPDHWHETGFDSRCGRCLDLRDRSRGR